MAPKTRLATLAVCMILQFQNCGRGTLSSSLSTKLVGTTTTSTTTSSSTSSSVSSTSTSTSSTTRRTTTTSRPTTTSHTTTSTSTTTTLFQAKPWANLSKFYAGATHVGGKYGFTPNTNFFKEGAERMQGMGFKSAFFYLVPDMSKYYADNGGTPWPTNATNLKDMFLSPAYQETINKNFEVTLLTTYNYSVTLFTTPAGWEQRVEDEMYQLTREMILRFANSGRTFVLKHWEGDWHLSPPGSTTEPPPERIAWMIKWLNARQRGVNRARNELGGRGVRIFHAAEVNRVRDAISGKQRMINAVIPNTIVDMVTYSSWDTTAAGSSATEAGLRSRFTEALDFINIKAPDPLGLGKKRIIVSEYGNDEATAQRESFDRVSVVLDVARAYGTWGAFYWEFFDNECADPLGGSLDNKSGLLPGDPIRPRNQDCVGRWIVRPDGTTSPLLNSIRAFWN